MSRGCDVAEGTFPQRTILFEMKAGSTLETPVVIEDSRVSRSLSLEGFSSNRGVCITVDRMGSTGSGDGVRAAVNCCRKDRQNHPSESREIEGSESRASTKQRGNRARTLRRSGDHWRGRDGVDLVNGISGGGDNGGVGEFVGDPSILV